MIEKFFSLAMCLVLMSLLAACGSSAEAQEVQESGSYPNPPKATETGSYPNDSQDDIVANIPDDSIPEGGHTAAREGDMMRVLWTVSGYVIGENATWGETEAQAMLFKPLDITDTEIIFDSQVCSGVNFQQETVNATEYLSDVWKITQQDLGIDFQEVQVFKTNCSLPGFQEYIRLGDRRLIVPINGVFFLLEPAVTY